MSKIFYCEKCEKHTMKKVCDCGADTINPVPPKYSEKDKYGKYRRIYKRQQIKEN